MTASADPTNGRAPLRAVIVGGSDAGMVARVTGSLGRLADECALMTRTRRLAGWVGPQRPVTPKGVLRPADVRDAAAALGASVPARVRTAADVEVIHRPWVAAQALELIRVRGD